jgi:hypothetical protein
MATEQTTTGRMRHGAGCTRALLGAGAIVAIACNAVLGINPATLECGDAGCVGMSGDLTGMPASVVAPDAGIAAGSKEDIDAPVASGEAPVCSGAAETQCAQSPVESSMPSSSAIPAADAVPGVGGGIEPGVPPASAGGPQLAAGPALGADGLAVALPNDLIGAPVAGEIVFSDDAVWEVNGVFQPTFEVHTPTASYWIVKPLGTMVSMQEGVNGSQWIDFSSGFRPLRGVPSFAAPPVNVSTLRDDDSQTPTHLRLTSQSADGAWQWVWDFYLTHATFTVNRAPAPFGFAYRGVPGGTLGAEDRLVVSNGTSQSARSSFNADLTGPVEWAYLADDTLGLSLFLLQHTDDILGETYQVRDNDSAHWSFGDGQITALPIRFSLGLIRSTEHATVAARVQFVAGAIH